MSFESWLTSRMRASARRARLLASASDGTNTQLRVTKDGVAFISSSDVGANTLAGLHFAWRPSVRAATVAWPRVLVLAADFRQRRVALGRRVVPVDALPVSATQPG